MEDIYENGYGGGDEEDDSSIYLDYDSDEIFPLSDECSTDLSERLVDAAHIITFMRNSSTPEKSLIKKRFRTFPIEAPIKVKPKRRPVAYSPSRIHPRRRNKKQKKMVRGALLMNDLAQEKEVAIVPAATVTVPTVPAVTNSVTEDEEDEEGSANDGFDKDPSYKVWLSADDVAFCEERLKERVVWCTKPVRGEKLLLRMQENKKTNMQTFLTAGELDACEFTAKPTENVYCVLCDASKVMRLHHYYLSNAEKCDYHGTCKKCFIFSKTLLKYKYGDNIVSCPLQAVSAFCRTRPNGPACSGTLP